MGGQRIRAGQRGARLAVLTIALLALTTGCSSDAEQPSAQLPPASSSAAETTPALPPLGPEDFPVPDEARTQDEAGAEAFFRYYVELINRQQSIPDGQPLRELGPECEDCLRVARQYDEIAAAEQRVDGGELSITTRPGVNVSGDEARISFIVRVAALRILNASGSPVPNSSAEEQPRLPSGALLTWSKGRQSWLMRTLTIE